MNVYDFDGTVYQGDSTVDFYRYALRRKPSLLRFLPKQITALVLLFWGRIDKTQCKERFFCFLSGVDSVQLLNPFWDAHQHKICNWYRAQQAADDVILSASPEFLLRPICNRLGIEHLIASRVDPKSGAFTGANCRGQEKVHRWTEVFGAARPDRFYSDSLSDLPFARLARRAYRVTRKNITDWSTEI